MRHLLALLIAITASSAAAHDFWIELSNFHPTNQELVRVYLKVGENLVGEPVVRDARQIEQFVYGTNAVIGRDGKDPAGLFRADGSSAVAYRSRPTPIELNAVAFEKYLWLEGLDAVVAQRHERGEAQQPGRELFSRCAKALTGWNVDSSKALGQRFEIIPKSEPRVGELTVELLYEGVPSSNVLVVAINKSDPEQAQRMRTDAAGLARFTISRPGFWLIKAVHMAAAENNAAADWESLWASLTFDVR